MMLSSSSAILVAAAARRGALVHQPQRRSFLNWMTNYPDRINELKKLHQAGGRSTFTWQKQTNDRATNLVGAALVTWGFVQLVPGYWRLATGKGKLE